MTPARYKWRIDWRLTLLAAALLPLLLGLGLWQLERADAKRALAAAFDKRQAQLPRPVDELADDTPDYTPVSLAGRYLSERYFLLDNRVRNRQVGFEVVTPFETEAGRVVLVNRGWVAGDPGRRQLPQVITPTGQYRLTGYVYRQPAGPRLGSDAPGRNWPQVVQQLDVGLLAKRLDMPLPSYVVRLDTAAPTALVTGWPIINQSPATHVGYATQWFGLAAVLVIGWLLGSTNFWQLIRGSKNRGE